MYFIMEDTHVKWRSNVISSHWVLKSQYIDDGPIKPKGLITLNVHQDSRKMFRKDENVIDMEVMRMLLSVKDLLNFVIGAVDIKSAFMKYGLINLDLYLSPPRHRGAHGELLWMLLEHKYGLPEAGFQWLLAVEKRIMNEYGLETVQIISQF